MTAIYDSKRRTKPCSNCKQNKVKCEYSTSLPCSRCLKFRLQCYFPGSYNTTDHLVSNPSKDTAHGSAPVSNSFDTWTGEVISRIASFEGSLESVLKLVHSNHQQQQQQLNLLQSQLSQQQQHSVHDIDPFLDPAALDSTNLFRQYTDVKDFRTEQVLSRQQAKELMDLFIEKFSEQLYGYPLKDMAFDDLWDHSPLLLVSMCTIACRFHSELSHLVPQLRQSLEWFTTKAATSSFGCTKDSHKEYIILGLLLAALWFHSNQLYVAVAMQLSRIWGVGQRVNREGAVRFPKIFYLLYILDGKFSLINSRSPSIYKNLEPGLLSSRKHTIESIDDPAIKQILLESTIDDTNKLSHRQTVLLNEAKHDKILVSNDVIKNCQLLSQVEFHFAVESIFHNTNFFNGEFSSTNSMALIPPNRFGIPWETNMDIDRWMISWTIALQKIHIQQNPWCLKSTLLYYNYARMYFSTKPWIVSIQRDSLNGFPGDPKLLGVWDAKERDSNLGNNPKAVDQEIAYSAAKALLKLVTKDKDVVAIFQFLPVHVYLMVYFACLVLLSPDYIPRSAIRDRKEMDMGVLYSLVSNFKNMLANQVISDLDLQNHLNTNLTAALAQFRKEYAKFLSSDKQLKELVDAAEENMQLNLEQNVKPKSILAWPGTNHGHP
ncbi:HGL257Cp [Eremothecium sinecaudum]|uniref:HGL257Cp n=1 Tax=Eremothecium sinecaudum TaxID=45286 RepID=A0A120K2N2_9SACH|nr:HGL257Cp [Eremothecium sinecaudum]AMD22083.1 HGL257Cp [Eremothecium sinecaudum]